MKKIVVYSNGEDWEELTDGAERSNISLSTLWVDDGQRS